MNLDSMINLTEVSSLQELRDLTSKYYGKRKVGENKEKRKFVRVIKRDQSIFLPRSLLFFIPPLYIKQHLQKKLLFPQKTKPKPLLKSF